MKKRIQSTWLVVLLVMSVAGLLLSGCATVKPPALKPDAGKLDVSEESIALVAVKIANRYRTSYQPNVKAVFVNEAGLEKGKRYSFKVDDKYNEVKNEFNEYLISFQLPPGEYKLCQIFAQSGIFPVSGMFFVPIWTKFKLEPNQILYLGNIDTYVTKRMSDDLLRAGPVIPLIDQAATGASGGTFIINISDRFDDDILRYKQKYPQLEGFDIINATLPAWKQPTEEDMK